MKKNIFCDLNYLNIMFIKFINKKNKYIWGHSKTMLPIELSKVYFTLYPLYSKSVYKEGG